MVSTVINSVSKPSCLDWKRTATGLDNDWTAGLVSCICWQFRRGLPLIREVQDTTQNWLHPVFLGWYNMSAKICILVKF